MTAALDPGRDMREGSMVLVRDRKALFPGEELKEAILPQLAFWQDGEEDRPTVVFLPGSTHLARIAYGHPGSNPHDFLAHWLHESGFPFLALSYPSDHPVFPTHHPDVTVTDWAESSAALTRDILQEKGRRAQIALAGWSMAGHLCAAFAIAARKLGLDLELFVSLAATAPMPRLAPIGPGFESLTPEGFWDGLGATATGRDRRDRFAAGLAVQSHLAGRTILTLEEWEVYYRCNNPVQLLGSAHRLGPDGSRQDILAAIQDLRTFEFAEYPLVGAIVPESSIDARHALTDGAAWSFVNAQWLYHRTARSGAIPQLPQSRWQRLLRLSKGLSKRMTRRVAGSHFFFVGEPGAKKTAEYIAELHAESRRLEDELAIVLRSTS